MNILQLLDAARLYNGSIRPSPTDDLKMETFQFTGTTIWSIPQLHHRVND